MNNWINIQINQLQIGHKLNVIQNANKNTIQINMLYVVDLYGIFISI